MALLDTEARDQRMKWWREAGFGMFIHYNMFSQWKDPEYRHLEAHPEENSPEEHDRKRVAKLDLDKTAVRDWVQTAKAAGMKYVVLTTKHNGGFCLWDSKVTKFNSVRLGPQRDIVAEYVRECRKAGLKVGFYFALNDRHHGLVEAGRKTEKARRAIVNYTKGLLRELMTQYGKVDILWYDEPCPMGYGGEWDSAEINRMVRKLQPKIIINDRSLTYQDFTCSEGHITPTVYPDQDWECCMTFNGTWAWAPTPRNKYYSPQSALKLLWEVIHGGGRLLLNIGPNPYTGRMQDVEKETLLAVGKWLKVNGAAVYGTNDRPEGIGETKNNVSGKWTKHGRNAYMWLFKWPAKSTVTIKGARSKLLGCKVLGGKALKFTQDAKGITITGLPKACPDKVCGVGVLELKFASYPR